MNIKNVTLILTEKCNIDCSFCYQGTKDPKNMSPETSVKILKLLQNNISSEVHLSFSGGEPLLNFDLIRDIVEYNSGIPDPPLYKYSLITNGT
ncbi:MAG: radical SAM protein, partial [Candidatus Aminicenantes bacterium]|nr:radical SAM protein [Candidatus Aminicenantes bacterium]